MASTFFSQSLGKGFEQDMLDLGEIEGLPHKKTSWSYPTQLARRNSYYPLASLDSLQLKLIKVETIAKDRFDPRNLGIAPFVLHG